LKSVRAANFRGKGNGSSLVCGMSTRDVEATAQVRRALGRSAGHDRRRTLGGRRHRVSYRPIRAPEIRVPRLLNICVPLHLCPYSVKIYSPVLTLVGHANTLFASFPWGGLPARGPGVNVSDAPS